jgi:hypothetical protein
VTQCGACNRFGSGRVFALGIREDHAAALTIANIRLIPANFRTRRLFGR